MSDALVLCAGPGHSLSGPAANPGDEQSLDLSASFYAFSGNLFI